MIISKDLFLLGDQDYLRLPKDDKRSRNKPARSVSQTRGLSRFRARKKKIAEFAFYTRRPTDVSKESLSFVRVLSRGGGQTVPPRVVDPAPENAAAVVHRRRLQNPRRRGYRVNNLRRRATLPPPLARPNIYNTLCAFYSDFCFRINPPRTRKQFFSVCPEP